LFACCKEKDLCMDWEKYSRMYEVKGVRQKGFVLRS